MEGDGVRGVKLSQKVHRSLLLRWAEQFRDHKKGIPEWLKNSDDSYTRHEEFNNTDFNRIPIILNFSKDEIWCLDFGGASGSDMVDHLLEYGKPDAATYGRAMKHKVVSGGHGNGGKFYALAQFECCKVISYYRGKLSVIEINKEAEFEGCRDKPVSIEQAIQYLGLEKIEYFKHQGKEFVNLVKEGKYGLFCWKGFNPKDKSLLHKKQDLVKLLQSVINHPQARSALRSREIKILFRGETVLFEMKPQNIESIGLDEDFGIRQFVLPNELGEYRFNKSLKSALEVKLSKKPLTGDSDSLNILEIDAFGKNLAFYHMPQLLFESGSGIARSLYAHIDCPELKEYGCVTNDRVSLQDNPTTTVFLSWCKNRLQEVIDELTSKEKRKEQKLQLNELGEFLKEITDEVSELLEEDNLLKPTYKEGGTDKATVSVPGGQPGYGGDGHIKEKGGGKRSGGSDKKEEGSDNSRGKAKLRILLSNHDADPLDPEGKTRDMSPTRDLVLDQRVKDVPHGIWWINTQKKYIEKIDIRSPGARPFYLFLVKEIILAQRYKKRIDADEQCDLDRLNFGLIDDIFDKVTGRLGIELSVSQGNAEKIRAAIRGKKSFTVNGLAEELGIEQPIINVFLSNNSQSIEENFNKVRDKSGGKGPGKYIYTRKR